MPDLRKDFFDILLEMAKKDKRIIFLTGDLGFSFVENFQKELPKQFINCGIAEQNAVGVAAGLALGGKKPFVYSCSTFLLMRANEQVRDEVCYNNVNVKLIGTGASSFLGFSHNLKEDEDLTMLCDLPNIRVAIPDDKEELKEAMKTNYPTYIRL